MSDPRTRMSLGKGCIMGRNTGKSTYLDADENHHEGIHPCEDADTIAVSMRETVSSKEKAKILT